MQQLNIWQRETWENVGRPKILCLFFLSCDWSECIRLKGCNLECLKLDPAWDLKSECWTVRKPSMCKPFHLPTKSEYKPCHTLPKPGRCANPATYSRDQTPGQTSPHKPHSLINKRTNHVQTHPPETPPPPHTIKSRPTATPTGTSDICKPSH